MGLLFLLHVQSATQPPPRLTEAALIAAMEAYGIGTDATVAEHIQKQLDRKYARTPRLPSEQLHRHLAAPSLAELLGP